MAPSGGFSAAPTFTDRLWCHTFALDTVGAVDEGDPIQIRIGRAVRAVRLDRGMTQEKLAAACAMHPTYVSDIERGARNPSWKAIARLADGLDVPVATIAAAYDDLPA